MKSTNAGQATIDLEAVYTPEMWDVNDVVLWLGWSGKRAPLRTLAQLPACEPWSKLMQPPPLKKG